MGCTAAELGRRMSAAEMVERAELEKLRADEMKQANEQARHR